MNHTIREMAQCLLMARGVTVVAHIAPDGDTLGASCALALALERLHKPVVRYCADRIPARLAFLPGADSFTSSLDSAMKSDWVVAVDCAAPDRMGAGRALLEAGKRVMVLDHHGSNRGFGDLCYVSGASSASEPAFDLLDALGVELDAQMADCLYTGMVTDTGRFGFPGVTGDTLRRAAQTLESGAHYVQICRSQFQRRSLAATRLLGAAISSMELHFDGKMAMMSITPEIMAGCGGSIEDMEGIVNYASEIIGVEIGAMIYPASGRWKVSLRAAEAARVDRIADLLGGGGHAKAAGGRAHGTLEEAKRQVLEAVQEAKALS